MPNMFYQYSEKNLQAVVGLTADLAADIGRFRYDNINKILWNRGQDAGFFKVDGITYPLRPGQLATITPFQHLELPDRERPLTALVFNREFYCLIDHDSELACNGVLFYGVQKFPIISIPDDERPKFEALLAVLQDEFQTRDADQGDMLQALLKRFIIKATRLAKDQLLTPDLDIGQLEIVRRFNLLVDIHFRTKRSVADYAGLLNKSPKTLANLFAIYNQKSPLLLIHERVALEARRLLHYTDQPVKEIAYQLGFEDMQTFSRFFKKMEGRPPSEFRKLREQAAA